MHDGTKPTVDQMARDVAAFLVWTAEPNLEARHAAGFAVVIFLLIGTILGYLAYHQIWDEAKRTVRGHRPARPREPGEDPPRQERRRASPAESDRLCSHARRRFTLGTAFSRGTRSCPLVLHASCFRQV